MIKKKDGLLKNPPPQKKGNKQTKSCNYKASYRVTHKGLGRRNIQWGKNHTYRLEYFFFYKIKSSRKNLRNKM